MRRLGKIKRYRAVAAIIIAAALSAAIVGAGASSASDSGPVTLRAVVGGFPDYMDPQLSYTSEGWTDMYETYIPLLTFRRDSGRESADIVPGLAESLPRITDGGRKYTLFLRPGLRYSDGTRVRASDFEFAIERMFRLGSGGYPFYTVIAGARHYLRTKHGGISGIVTDNATGKIVIHLTRPTGTFSTLLALMFAAPVPPSTPMLAQSFQPPPGTGPYVFTSSDLSGWTYERNPVWDSVNGPLMPQLPRGHVDRIEVRVVRGGEAEAKAVIAGRADWMENSPASSQLAELRRHFRSQLRVDPILSTYYFWMNTTKPPFDDVRVRRAANYAVDPEAMARLYGGSLLPTDQILPPGMPGFHRFDLYRHNLARARHLVAAANPSDREITVWTDSESENAKAGAYFAGRLREIGFRVHLKVLPAYTYFFAIGKGSTPNLDAGWGNWFADYSHPDDFFRPMLLGSSILPFDNGNFARIAVPRLDARLEGLSRRRLGAATEREYARLDRGYMKLAPWVPYGTYADATFVSKDVELDRIAWNPLFGADLASFEITR